MVLQQHPQRCSDVTLGSPARKGICNHQTPKHGEENRAPGLPRCPGQDSGQQAPGISQHKDCIGQGRSERRSSRPPVGLKQVTKDKASAGTPGPGIGL